jgi:small-conductance mechanosensitive channel
MELFYLKIFESAVIVIVYFILRKICFKIIDKTLLERLIHKSRGIIIKKVINFSFLMICITFVLLIWGVNQKDLGIFVGSVLTVVGVAFFAQWSILSNITSSIIIFFNHPVKLNDSIVILESKDYVIEGKVINIGLFFITLITNESEQITLPNNIFIQKSIKNMSPATRTTIKDH